MSLLAAVVATGDRRCRFKYGFLCLNGHRCQNPAHENWRKPVTLMRDGDVVAVSWRWTE